MADDKLKIGDLAKAFGISVESLRYYEKAGILSSEREDNNYRYFDNNQICNMVTVSSLRSAGVPIKSVQDFVRSGNLYDIFKCLDDAEKKLSEEMRVLLQKRKKLYELSLLWHRMKEGDSEITIRESPQWWAAFVHDDLQMIRALTVYHNLAESGSGHIQVAYVADTDSLKTGEILYSKFAIVSDYPIHDDSLPVEIWDSRHCAYMLYVGECTDLPAAYNRLYCWVTEHQYTLSDNIVEIYLMNNAGQFALELWAPIAPA